MRIIKKAIKIGNGAAVYVPKEYGGKEVIVILPEGIEEIKKSVLSKLIGFMDNIAGVYLYGSFARHEEEKGSDIDILVITKEKDDSIKMALKDVDLKIVTLEGVRKAIKKYPLLIVPILREARVLLNPLLLEELKNSGIDFRRFKWNFEDIRRIVKIIETFIEIDEENISASYVYSLIMRIRVCYLIECLLKDKKFSNQGVRASLLNYGLDKERIDNYFEIYRKVRQNEEVREKIKKEEILKLISILRKSLERVKNETKKKIGKRH